MGGVCGGSPAGSLLILKLAEKALDNVPAPGAKAAVGSILLIVERIGV